MLLWNCNNYCHLANEFELDEVVERYYENIIPHTAVFGPNNFIETATTASTAQYYGTDDSLWISKSTTARMTVYGFLNLDF